MIANDTELALILPGLQGVERVAVDTESDSLHCYYEKLCLVQMSFGGQDYLIDPLAGFSLEPLATADVAPVTDEPVPTVANADRTESSVLA